MLVTTITNTFARYALLKRSYSFIANLFLFYNMPLLTMFPFPNIYSLHDTIVKYQPGGNIEIWMYLIWNFGEKLQ